MSSETLGELFGVDIHYPFVRSEIRQIVKSKSALADSLVASSDVSIYEAFNDLGDIQTKFMETLSEEQVLEFYEIFIEETNARTNALNDEADRLYQQTIQTVVNNDQSMQILWGILGLILLIIFLIFLFSR